MFRNSLTALLAVTVLFLSLQLADAGPPQKPTAPTNAIFTYSPLFGDAYTVRAAWSPPKKWNDGGTGTRKYLATCFSAQDGVFYSVEVPDNVFLVQFQVPALHRRYKFVVYAINGLGNQGKGDSYPLAVP